MRQKATQSPSVLRRSLPEPIGRLAHPTSPSVSSVKSTTPREGERQPPYGDRARARASQLDQGDQRSRSRPRGPPRHPHRNLILTRGIQRSGPYPVQAGPDPGELPHGRRERGIGRRGGHGDATGGRRHAAAPRHGSPRRSRCEPWRMFAQFMGRVDGPTRGRDGNVHMADDRLGLIAMVSHLPAMLPVAVGAALAFRIREEKRVAVGWFGEGASARGDTHESMNMAGVRRLPVVFVCDNNQWAYSTPTHLEFACETIVATEHRRTGSTALSWTEPTCSRSTAKPKRAIEKAREGGGPTLIECLTLRMEGHAVDDDAFYVPKEIVRGVGRARPARALPDLASDNADFTDEEEGAISPSRSRRAPERSDPESRTRARCPSPRARSKPSTPLPKSSRLLTTIGPMAVKTYLQAISRRPPRRDAPRQAGLRDRRAS